MKITKLGHCALVLESDGVKILTDPGSFTIQAQGQVTGLDAVLITHEHQDHFHIDSVKVLLQKNPNAAIITNGGVGKLLKEQGIEKVVIVGDGQSTDLKGMKIEGFGKDHAIIYDQMGLVENTGYMVAGKFYFPGDNFHNPGRPVDILALPVAGPWMKISEAINFAKEIKARAAFSVHDGMIVAPFRAFMSMVLKAMIPQTEYTALEDGESKEF
jgi:L-ascorbate metabolism protein UlaG (beta-lactamase superfamily)